MIRKLHNGQWRADIRPNGARGKRYRKTFDTKAEALRWEAWIKANKTADRDWEPKRTDHRTLKQLIEVWFRLHGKFLKDGEARKRQLEHIADAVGNPRAVEFTSQTFTVYRKDRLEAGISPNTVNHDHAYLRALFNELERLGEWAHGNPVAKIRRLKVDETELTFLTTEQIKLLLSELKKGRNKHTYLVACICLATGARWSEAESLRAEQVRSDSITFSSTKSGKVRVVPITSDLHDLVKHRNYGRLFAPCYSAFRDGVERAGIKLPAGQLSHVLRHTFASHFMMAGGNIVVLQRILGHANLTMTMRYSHFAPDHLEQARVLNPLDRMGHFLDTSLLGQTGQES